MERWKAVARKLFVVDFKELAKYYYGLEVGQMANQDNWRCGGRGVGRIADTVNLAMKLLFERVTPELLSRDEIAQLIAYAFKWFYYPNLEGNNKWNKSGVQCYLESKGARVTLSETMTDGNRSHSIIRLFKKYGTQSALKSFKRDQGKHWGFVIEIGMYRQKDDSMPACGSGTELVCSQYQSLPQPDHY